MSITDYKNRPQLFLIYLLQVNICFWTNYRQLSFLKTGIASMGGLLWWFRGKKKKICLLMQETKFQFVGWEDPLEKEMQPTPNSCLGHPMEGFSPWGHKRVRHDLVTIQQQQ